MRWKFFLIFLATFAAFYMVVPMENKPFFMKGEALDGYKLNLGIDLRGGAALRYQLQVDPTMKDKNVREMTEKARSIFMRRIDIMGLSEPNITVQGEDSIVVMLAGVDEDGLKRYKEIFEKVGSLHLKEVGNGELHRKNKFPDPVSDWTWIDNTEKDGGKEYPHLDADKILVHEKAVIDGTHVVTATTNRGGDGGFVVSFTLTDKGARLFKEATEKLAGKGHIAIILDGKLQSRPFVRSAITKHGQIDGYGTEEEAKKIATVLRSGSLPAPIRLISENFVGATLGEDSITRGLYACIVSVAVVALIMIVYYRVLGIIAIATLLQNIIVLLAIMTVFNATLTLPGIAGLVLTVGMAVDSNILVFERMREEKAKGKTAAQAFEAGHERAFVTILDSNLTTLIAAVVLYSFGSGPVRGFAVTLSIGIFTTMFSVLVFGKMLLRALVHSGSLSSFSMMSMFVNSNIGFVRVARLCVTLSALLVAGGILVFGATGDEKYGIDFKGGSELTVNFLEERKVEDVRAAIKKMGEEKYPGISLQPLARMGKEGLGGSREQSATYLIRTANENVDEVKGDLRKVFGDLIPPGSSEKLPTPEIPTQPMHPYREGDGYFFYVVNSVGADPAKVADAIRKDLKEKGLARTDKFKPDEVLVSVEKVGDACGGKIGKYKLLVTREDKENLEKIWDAVKRNKDVPLVANPFIGESKIGPVVASELKSSTIMALIWSWFLMIIYIAFRFSSWKFGVAAVIALVHDALISVGVVALCVNVVPESWGLSFEFNVSSIAAILTIIGYSVNDTIVVFDRIRENLVLMRKEPFAEVINASVNQTMSRTIMTSFTVWITVVILYVMTIGSGAGIESFAFPLIVGLIVGTYSTIYIASPILIWWYRGTRPVIAK